LSLRLFAPDCYRGFFLHWPKIYCVSGFVAYWPSVAGSLSNRLDGHDNLAI
jgi:hypothetical protein